MEKKNENYESIHSEDLEDIITTPPSWLLKRGIGFVFLSLVLILAISFIIRYPDIVNAKLTITATILPKTVTNVSPGVIVKISKSDGANVRKDESISYIESNTDHYTALSILNKLYELIQNDKDLPKINMPNSSNLGQLQSSYHTFYILYENYIHIPAFQEPLGRNKKEKLELVILVKKLINQIEDWKKLYVLIAPVSGTISYSGLIEEGQYAEINTNIFYVYQKELTFFGSMQVAQENIGKVKKGQRVHIKLKSFPYHEYGFLIGEITKISQFPTQNNAYFSRVKIFRNSADSAIILKHGMFADAEIVTDNYSVFKRIWLNLLKSITA